MMENFTAIITLTLAAIIQNTIVTRINLLAGAADLVLIVLLSWILQTQDKNLTKWGIGAGLLVGLSSATPIYITILGYLIVVGFVMLLLSRIWQAPYWMLLTSTFVGTIIVYGIETIYFWVNGYPFVLDEVLNLVILPSVVLNILLVIPVYLFVGEIVKMVSSDEVKV
jgi:rod shape-determining protein MreD